MLCYHLKAKLRKTTKCSKIRQAPSRNANCPKFIIVKIHIIYLICSERHALSSAVGTTECMLINFFFTEMMNKPGNEERCHFAQIRADQCIKMGVYGVSMSDRNTANKL